VSASAPIVRPWKPSSKAMNEDAGLAHGMRSLLLDASNLMRCATELASDVRPRRFGDLQHAWYLRANLMAASLASVPELAKNTRSANDVSTSVRASAGPGSLRYRLLTWHSLPACSRSASCHPWSLWPSTFTAMPAVKSRYGLSAAGAASAQAGVLPTAAHVGTHRWCRTARSLCRA